MTRTALINIIRRMEQYDVWKKAVFIRDRFTCQQCGARNGRKRVIEADHIIPLSQLIKDNTIRSIEEAAGCPLLWEIANGRTLCRSCHELTESYPKNFKRKKRRNDKKRKRLADSSKV